MNIEQKIAEQVTLYNVKQYLRFKGWVIRQSPREDIILYHRPEESLQYEEIWIPKREDDPFYVKLILGVAERLSVFENRSILDVLLSLKSPYVDQMSFRMISENAEFGSIELGCVNNLFHGITSVCSIALKDYQEPSLVHKRAFSKLTQELQKYARFGQTSRGSFTVNIYIPVSVPQNQESENRSDELSELKENNLFRDGMTHFMSALSDANESILTGEIDEFSQKNFEKPVISANMCDTISKINIWDDMQLEISAKWSPLVPVPATVPNRICIPQKHFSIFRSWVNDFSPKQKISIEMEFRGVVIEMMGNEEQDGKTTGYVKINVIDRDGQNFHALVHLENKTLYKIASESHLNKKYVKFTGNYIPGGSPKEITDISGFVLDEPASPQETFDFTNSDIEK